MKRKHDFTVIDHGLYTLCKFGACGTFNVVASADFGFEGPQLTNALTTRTPQSGSGKVRRR